MPKSHVSRFLLRCHAVAVLSSAGVFTSKSPAGGREAELARLAHVAVSYVWKLESGAAAPSIDLQSRLATALGTTAHDLLPIGPPPDSLAILRNRAKALFEDLLQTSDEATLTMLCPLLARLGGSPTRRR